MIGALINTYRGFKENSELKSRKYTLEKELSELDSVDKMLAHMEDPYERVVAQNQLTLAEYMNERQDGQPIQAIKNTWELVKKQMATNIELVEGQLNQLQATKLDIARIVATLSQLSNELDLELDDVKQRVSMNEELRTKIEEFQDYPLITKLKNQSDKQNIDILKLKHSMNEFTEEYSRFKVQLEQANAQLTSLDKAHTVHKEAYDKYKYTTNYKLSELQTQANDMHKNVDTIVDEMQEVIHELSALNELVETRMDRLEYALQDSKRQWADRANRLDRMIQVNALQTKNLILKLTIPLYVIVVGIIVAMFIF